MPETNDRHRLPQPGVRFIRYTRLNQVVQKALDESLKVLTPKNIKHCFPHLQNTPTDLETLDLIQANLEELWKDGCMAEFEAIFKERNIKEKLDELDELIHVAQRRSEEQPDVTVNEHESLSTNGIVQSYLLTVKENILKGLEEQLNHVREENHNLLDELNDLADEARKAKSDIMESFHGLEKLSEIDDSEGLLRRHIDELVKITEKEELLLS